MQLKPTRAKKAPCLVSAAFLVVLMPWTPCLAQEAAISQKAIEEASSPWYSPSKVRAKVSNWLDITNAAHPLTRTVKALPSASMELLFKPSKGEQALDMFRPSENPEKDMHYYFDVEEEQVSLKLQYKF